MITQRAQGLFHVMLAGQIALALSLYWTLAYGLIFSQVGFVDPFLQNYCIYAVLVVVALLLEASTRKEKYTRIFTPNVLNKERLAVRQTFFVAALIVTFLVATKDLAVSRAFIFSYIPLLYFGLILTHYLVPIPLSRLFFGGVRKERILLVGSYKRASLFLPWIQDRKLLGFDVVGLVTEDIPALENPRMPTIGHPDNLESLLEEHDISLLMMVEIPSNQLFLNGLPRLCERHTARLVIASDLADKLGHPLYYFDDGGYHFIGLRQEPMEDPWNRVCKRLFDIALSLLVCAIILPPATVVVWLMQRWQSHGPLLFRQIRAGIQNQTFEMLKFRTMPLGSETRGSETLPGDARIYPFGRFLRRFSLDELPQFINVLRGEMSVVGPRPHHIEHNERFALALSHYNVRSMVKPGITGLAQVRGFRGLAVKEEDLEARVEMDIYYIENWSLFIDCVIVLKTAWQMVFPPRNAY